MIAPSAIDSTKIRDGSISRTDLGFGLVGDIAAGEGTRVSVVDTTTTVSVALTEHHSGLKFDENDSLALALNVSSVFGFTDDGDSLTLRNESISTNMIVPGAIDSTKIRDGSIDQTDLGFDTISQILVLADSVSGNGNGQIRFISGNNMRIDVEGDTAITFSATREVVPLNPGPGISIQDTTISLQPDTTFFTFSTIDSSLTFKNKRITAAQISDHQVLKLNTESMSDSVTTLQSESDEPVLRLTNTHEDSFALDVRGRVQVSNEVAASTFRIIVEDSSYFGLMGAEQGTYCRGSYDLPDSFQTHTEITIDIPLPSEFIDVTQLDETTLTAQVTLKIPSEGSPWQGANHAAKVVVEEDNAYLRVWIKRLLDDRIPLSFYYFVQGIRR